MQVLRLGARALPTNQVLTIDRFEYQAMNRSATRRLFSRVAAFILLMLVLQGCDTTSSDNAIVFNKVNIPEFRFEFPGDMLSEGQALELTTSVRVDLTDELDRLGGFTKDDVIGATVQSAQLFQGFPVTQKLGYLDQAIVKLVATSPARVTEVADVTNPDDLREVDMSLIANRDVSTYVKSSEFTAVLQITPGSTSGINPDESYTLAVLLTMRIEVEDI